MSQDDPNKSIDAQIGEHMAQMIASEPFVQEVEYINETMRDNLIGPYGTVVRTYLPEYALEDSDRARISVLPVSRNQLRFTRSHFQEDYVISTIVHQRLKSAYLPDYSGKKPSKTIEDRRKKWRENITEYGDNITKLADQIALVFEPLDCCGAVINVPDCSDSICAKHLNVVRGQMYEMAEVDDKHVIFCVLRHTWRLYRPVKTYA